MSDKRAEVWTRLPGYPIKMGDLYVTDKESRFTYSEAYLKHNDLPGIGLVYSPEIYQNRSMSRLRNNYFDFFPPIQALLPPNSQHNFQRNLIQKYIYSKGDTFSNQFDLNWQILMLSGHGGIGHLDVFPSEHEAIQWYSSITKQELNLNLKKSQQDESFGSSLKAFLTWFDHDAKGLLDIIGPTPSVGGAIPKLLLSIPSNGWEGRFGLPTKAESQDVIDVVLKFEQSNLYPGVTELEALGLKIHQQAGFEVPRFWTTQINGIPAIAVERFDRTDRNRPLFQESIYSVLASGSKAITDNHSTSYDHIVRMLDNPRIKIVDERMEAKKHLLSRLLLAFLTGNGDLHLENLSLLRRNGKVAFSPVYDPVPMRAYSIHNMVTPMPFGDYGEFVEHQDAPINFNQALERFIKTLGFNRNYVLGVIENLLQVTKDYPADILALSSLPQQNKDNLVAIHLSIKNKLLAFFK